MEQLSDRFRLSVAFAALMALGGLAQGAQTAKPNILFIVSDDTGYGDLGPYGGGEGRGEQPVDHRRLPLEEGFAVEGQGQATEHQAGDQGQPLALFQLALFDEQRTVDHQGADDQHRRGAVNTAYSHFMASDVDDPWIKFVNDEEQQKRDEIDELFHSESQKLDVAA